MVLNRITIDPNKMGGVPCIRGMRIPVATIIALIADGLSSAEILDYYPDLENDDIKEALYFASLFVKDRMLPLINAL